MEQLIRRKEISRSLTNADIHRFLDGNCNVLSYQDLKNFQSINQVLYPFGCTVLLYELHGPDNGHWVYVNKSKTHKNTIEFFDPYGGKPEELIFNRKYYFKDAFPLLAQLIHDGGYKLVYNNMRFQVARKGINTCGRWVLIRHILSFLDLDEFEKLFKSQSYTLSRDELATALTLFLK